MRQKSFNHQLNLPLSVALQAEAMQESTCGPNAGEHRARGSETLNCWKHPVQHCGIVWLPDGGWGPPVGWGKLPVPTGALPEPVGMMGLL